LTTKEDVYNRSMKKKKGKSPRRILAEKTFKDPKSPAFLSKVKSLKLAGYSDKVAEHKSSELLRNVNFTDADIEEFKSFAQQDSKVDQLLWRKLEQLAKEDKISAKDYANLLHQKELDAKLKGKMIQLIEKKVAIVNVGIPRQKCPECGHTMDYLKEGEE